MKGGIEDCGRQVLAQIVQNGGGPDEIQPDLIPSEPLLVVEVLGGEVSVEGLSAHSLPHVAEEEGALGEEMALCQGEGDGDQVRGFQGSHVPLQPGSEGGEEGGVPPLHHPHVGEDHEDRLREGPTLNFFLSSSNFNSSKILVGRQGRRHKNVGNFGRHEGLSCVDDPACLSTYVDNPACVSNIFASNGFIKAIQFLIPGIFLISDTIFPFLVSLYKCPPVIFLYKGFLGFMDYISE